MRAKLRNLLGAVPLLAWYGWGLSQEAPTFLDRYVLLSTSARVDALLALQIIAQGAVIAFTFFLVVLLLVRDVPRARARGAAAYAATMVGSFAIASFLFLPAATASVPLFAIAALCITLGSALSLYTLIYLGRSFALLPSARRLVTDGPYRFVRHPLYLFEEIAVLGVMIQFAQPWSLIVMLVHAVAQFARMHYEERALTEAFPEYAAYAARTARLIPGLY
ncbi:MAG: isoprenylcysteine carboxylmethyltransferase family protein [Patescibacteria group bacterium]|nr:isoprenylcysteine carboxylmethyltransferase family protein [Patescibacteria group bacterium]